jgi:hypothetical protein
MELMQPIPTNWKRKAYGQTLVEYADKIEAYWMVWVFDPQ